MQSLSPISSQSSDELFACDVKEDMVTTLLCHYGFFNSKEGPCGTVQTNRSWFVFPYTLNSLNPLAMRTWYVLKDTEGNTEALATQTWASLFWGLFSFALGDAKYYADYTLYDANWNQVGFIDGHMIDLGREFDLINAAGFEEASICIGKEARFANIYLKNSYGKIGEIKIDCETLERGDYRVSCKKNLIDPRLLKIFSAIAVHRALISSEEQAPCHVVGA